jgi:hypothetical protein
MNIEIRFNGSAIAEQTASSIEEAEWLIDGYSASDAYDWCADEDADADWHAAKDMAAAMYSIHVLGYVI